MNWPSTTRLTRPSAALPEDGPGIAVVGLAAYHAQHVDPETVASMLAVAVSRLAREDS